MVILNTLARYAIGVVTASPIWVICIRKMPEDKQIFAPPLYRTDISHLINSPFLLD
jgi:hypothetical protein